MKHFQQPPSDPIFVQNPYRFYDRARADGDLFFWDELGTTCAVSHQAVQAALRDKRMGREVPVEYASRIPAHVKAFYDVEAHSMLELEPPRHTRLRSLVLRAFTSRTISALAPQIDALCNTLIDAFPKGPFDLLDAYARPVPVIIICRLLGVPESHADDLLHWSNAMVAMYATGRTRAIEDTAEAATKEFIDFMRDYINQRRKNPGDDLISTLIAVEEAGEKLNEDELITTCILLLNAGHEATVHTLGNGVKTLLEHDCRDITESCVEEILRFEQPLHLFMRWINEDLEFYGHRFKRGDQIACLLGAANRDAAAYPNPHAFDPKRKGPQNTSFGGGIHFCVGAPLARLELRIALQKLFARCPKLRLAQPARFGAAYPFHGLGSLLVETGR